MGKLRLEDLTIGSGYELRRKYYERERRRLEKTNQLIKAGLKQFPESPKAENIKRGRELERIFLTVAKKLGGCRLTVTDKVEGILRAKTRYILFDNTKRRGRGIDFAIIDTKDKAVWLYELKNWRSFLTLRRAESEVITRFTDVETLELMRMLVSNGYCVNKHLAGCFPFGSDGRETVRILVNDYNILPEQYSTHALSPFNVNAVAQALFLSLSLIFGFILQSVFRDVDFLDGLSSPARFEFWWGVKLRFGGFAEAFRSGLSQCGLFLKGLRFRLFGSEPGAVDSEIENILRRFGVEGLEVFLSAWG